MKITDPDVIKNGEKDLIDAVRDDLDLIAVKEVLQKRIKAAALSSTGGEIIVHNNEIAFRLDFDLNLSGSLMFDRQGNYIPELGDDAESEPENQEEIISEDLDLDDQKLDIVLPEYDLTDDLDTVGGDELIVDDPESEKDNIIQDDLADDDINDILKESQDFWEQKKDS